jgi:hypothetical protein
LLASHRTPAADLDLPLVLVDWRIVTARLGLQVVSLSSEEARQVITDANIPAGRVKGAILEAYRVGELEVEQPTRGSFDDVERAAKIIGAADHKLTEKEKKAIQSLSRARKDTSPVLASPWANGEESECRGPIEKKAAMDRARPSSSRLCPSQQERVLLNVGVAADPGAAFTFSSPRGGWGLARA